MEDQTLRSALTAQVMEMRQDGINNVTHYCVACDKTVSEPLPHLKGKDHHNNLVWYTLQRPSPCKELLDALPAVVRAAKLRKELELVDKAHFSYRCLVCPKKNPFSGIKPLEDHLNGKEHEKAMKMRLVPAISQVLPSQVPPQPTYPDTQSSQFLPSASSCPADVERALENRIVERGLGTFFKCLVCNVCLTGLAPLQEHLNSRQHKKKVTQPPLTDMNKLSIVGDGRQIPESDSAGIGVARDDQSDGSWTFPWTVVSTTPPRMKSDSVYRNLSTPRGLVLIFNYYFTGKGGERFGAKRDSFNLHTLFTSMGYQVYLYEDLNKTETEDKLQKQQDSMFLHHYDSFIVFIMSHGKDNMHFTFTDGEFMSLEDVRNHFTDTSCPALKGKPKLFFANYCRGELREPRTQYDSMGVQKVAPRDMVTVYACISNFQAPRDKHRGTVFVQVLCEVLAAHAHHMEMQDLHIEVCKLIEMRKGSTPEIQGFHFKKFYFNPIQQ